MTGATMRRTRELISFSCERLRDDGTACPVRFSWLGPARETHTAEDEGVDARSALDVAENLGWTFGEVAISCPRHRRRDPDA